MSKDEMKPARIDRRLTAAHERIEELERAVEFQKKAWTADLAENDTLLADNARLRKVLKLIKYETDIRGNLLNKLIKQEAIEALAATPAQSLARLRNQVLEKAAEKIEGQHTWITSAAASALIRAMKEQE